MHFKQSTQSLFQCNGKKWIPWVPSNSSNINELETVPATYLEDKEKQEKPTDYLITTSETPILREIGTSTDFPSAEHCPKGNLSISDTAFLYAHISNNYNF